MLRKTGAPRRGAPSFLLSTSLGLLVIFLFTALLPCVKVLTIDVDGRILWSQEIKAGKELVYSHVHSVEKTPVRELFHIEGDGFHLVRAEMSSVGAGLPATHSGGLALVDGKFVLDLDVRLRELNFLLSPETLPTLTANGEDIALYSYPTGASLNVRIVRRHLLWFQLRRLMP